MSLELGESSIDDSERDLPSGQQLTSLLAEAARSPGAIGHLLEACRGYLLVVAGEELASDVRVKMANSDLVQQTLVEAYQGFGGFRGATAGELLAWLRRVLLNNVVDTTRGFRATEKRALHREVSLEADGSYEGLVRGLVAADPSPSMQAIATEERERLFRSLAMLSEKDQQIVRLRNWEQLPFAEIGRQLETTEEAARKLWTRAVRRLARELKQCHDEAPL